MQQVTVAVQPCPAVLATLVARRWARVTGFATLPARLRRTKSLGMRTGNSCIPSTSALHHGRPGRFRVRWIAVSDFNQILIEDFQMWEKPSAKTPRLLALATPVQNFNFVNSSVGNRDTDLNSGQQGFLLSAINSGALEPNETKFYFSAGFSLICIRIRSHGSPGFKMRLIVGRAVPVRSRFRTF